jgi:hypothetical protein
VSLWYTTTTVQYNTVYNTSIIRPANARACPNTYIIILLFSVGVDTAVPCLRHQLLALAERFGLLHLLCGLR